MRMSPLSAKVVKPPTVAIASSTRRSRVSGIWALRATSPTTETNWLFISTTITVTSGAVTNSASSRVRTSFSSTGVRPSACTSSSSGNEIFPSGRTGTRAESSSFFHTAICSTSVTPIT